MRLQCTPVLSVTAVVWKLVYVSRGHGDAPLLLLVEDRDGLPDL